MLKQSRWSENKSNKLFIVSMTLTNYHITFYPTRENDGDAAITFCKRLYQVGTTTYERKRANEMNYLENQKHRVSCYLPQK